MKKFLLLLLSLAIFGCTKSAEPVTPPALLVGEWAFVRGEAINLSTNMSGGVYCSSFEWGKSGVLYWDGTPTFNCSFTENTIVCKRISGEGGDITFTILRLTQEELVLMYYDELVSGEHVGEKLQVTLYFQRVE